MHAIACKRQIHLAGFNSNLNQPIKIGGYELLNISKITAY